jgi:hypothetical protein
VQLWEVSKRLETLFTNNNNKSFDSVK